MATVGEYALTFNDLKKRQNPDGTIADIIDIITRSDPIMEHIRWAQGNLPTGNQTTQRTSVPQAELRRINRGVGNVKSTTRQITDTCAMLEAHSQIDVELLGLQPDPMAFRTSEDMAIVEGMTQQVADMIFYGDSDVNPDEFNGLAARYNAFGGEKNDYSWQVVNAGGTTENKQASAWLVGFGDRAVMGIYPKYGFAGLKQQDMGEDWCTDETGKKFRGVTTLFNWKAGLAVRDPRMVAAVRNIDMETLKLESVTAEQKKALIDKMVIAQHKIRSFAGADVAWYVPTDVMTLINLYYMDKDNVYITRKDNMTGMPEYYVNGIRVLEEQALTTTEAVVQEAE